MCAIEFRPSKCNICVHIGNCNARYTAYKILSFRQTIWYHSRNIISFTKTNDWVIVYFIKGGGGCHLALTTSSHVCMNLQ